jgi:hypothetical protein
VSEREVNPHVADLLIRATGTRVISIGAGQRLADVSEGELAH